MLQWVEKRLYPRLKNHEFANNEEMHLFLLLEVAIVFAFITHTFLLTFFLVTQVWVMVSISVLSFFFDGAILYLLHRHRAYKTIALTLAFEVIVYVFFMAFCVGTNSYCILYLALLLIIQLMLPMLRPGAKVSMLLLIWGSMITLYYVQLNFQPWFSLGNTTLHALALTNLTMCVAGISIEVTIGNILVRVINDYNSLQMETLESEANTDPLTGLLNRRYAQDLFQQVAQNEKGPTCCLAMMDIDDFKHINDQYGHAAGDTVLLEITQLMRGHLRKTDYIFRWGGEEFLILLEDVNLSTAYSIMEKLRQTFENRVVYVGTSIISFTVTIGLTELDRKDIAGSIERSDELLYIGKKSGKNRVTF